MAVAIVTIAFAGFSRTWFLKRWTGAPPLPTSVHVHGAAATAFLLLFLTQTVLIDRRRVKVHRQLGAWGLVIAAAMAVSAFPAAIDMAVQRGMTPPAIARMALPFVVAPTFFAFVCLGVWFRRDREAHVRWMLLAAIQAVTPALGRLPVLDQMLPASFVASIALLLACAVVHDLMTLRRVHGATLAGVVIIGLSVPGRVLLGTTAIWASFAARLVG